jgi:hypothetical protein
MVEVIGNVVVHSFACNLGYEKGTLFGGGCQKSVRESRHG